MFATTLAVATIAAAPSPGTLEGPRVGFTEAAGEQVTLWGAAGAGRRVLAAGDADVLAAQAIGCPPDDADLWLLPRATPAALAAATAAFRPQVTVVFGRGARSEVTGAHRLARSYANRAGLPYVVGGPSATIEVTLAARPGPRTASRLAYALDGIAGTRFAAGAQLERHRLMRRGQDPRRHGKT